MLTARELTKTYRSGERTLAILDAADLTLSPGDAAVVTGPSGVGKSTLLYLLGAIEEPTSGTVTLDGVDPFTLGEADRAGFRSREIGFVFQDHHLLPQCTLQENVLVPLLADGKAGADDVRRADELLDAVGLADRRLHRPASLSGGERQRAAFCRALINRPKLVLADEPTGNLDPATAEVVARLLLELVAGRETMLVCVTHSMDLAATFPRRLQMDAGKLVETPDRAPTSEATASEASTSEVMA